VYIYICEAKPRYKDRHRTYYAVRVHHDGRVGDWKRFAADFAMLEEFAEPYQDLLERQLRLILKRLTATNPRS
jgi:hypothetical protein